MTEADHRLRILPVEFTLLAEVLRGKVALSDLPDDLEIVGVNSISLFRIVELIVKSKSFESLNVGMKMPRMDLLAAYRIEPDPKPAGGELVKAS